MKKCPNSHMTVDAYSECPICNCDITNELENKAQIEGYRINKYFFIHLIKKHKFSLFCTTFVLITLLITIKSFSYWQVVSIILTVIMWVEALYKNLVFKMFNSIYSDGYLDTTHKITIYMCGLLAIIVAFL